ncbi:hypothetical protein UFOVP75_64 [uncultured Caudovirales phage]|uniref:Uncharacterized protein n=1 Tax=uncultured Caudovirales phage TaxID=2100421 RepID=A0A6J5L3J6_9CAUD|nr:hypothetical protein UFOVP75_64 [uncultured Caudovirales phage]
MTQSVTTDQGTIIIPGAYPRYDVASTNNALPTSGVLMLVGEADAGPDFSLELDLEQNAFGPDQDADVKSKYKSGPLVDAYLAAIAPATDPQITGAPAKIVLAKTNPSAKATLTLNRFDSTAYGVIADKSFGKSGNLINVSVEAASAEAVPTTGSFTYIPAVGTVAIDFRVNGAASVSTTLGANASPAVARAAIAGLSGLAATGAADRAAAPASGNIALTALTSNSAQVDVTVAFAVLPVIGDTFVVPSGSVIAGTANANVGAYVVTAASANQLVATKLSDGGKSGATPGTVTALSSVVSGALSGTPANDMKVFSPMVISNAAGNPIDGAGKSLEIGELTTGTDLLSRTAFALNATPVTFVSKAAGAKLITSATEYIATLHVNRQLDNSQQDFTVGGDVVLTLGYTGTSCAVAINDTTFTTTVVGGAGTSLSVNLADFPTLNDLATFINSKPGYNCQVGSGIFGQLSTKALDDVSVGAATTFGAATARLKADAFKLFKAINEQGALIQLQDSNGLIVQASKGLPAPSALAFLSGGTKGGTTAAAFSNAITALENVRGNFVIPLVSRDATADIADGLTESTSTYQIDAVNAAVKSHCIKMSALKRRRSRQFAVSKKDTFAAVKLAASNVAFFRGVMTFQDQKTLSVDGTIKQQQPWMGAVLACAMQAAGFYRPIVNKGINCSGVLQAARDFDDRSIDQMEQALIAGLLPAKKADGGGFVWVSDQTTYGKDSNFVFNSLQAVYMADTLAAYVGTNMEKSFVGQSLADVTAQTALSSLSSLLKDAQRLKMIAPSDDAPAGFKNAKIKIVGPSMFVSFEAKLAGALYFVPINFLVSQITQTAST